MNRLVTLARCARVNGQVAASGTLQLTTQIDRVAILVQMHELTNFKLFVKFIN